MLKAGASSGSIDAVGWGMRPGKDLDDLAVEAIFLDSSEAWVCVAPWCKRGVIKGHQHNPLSQFLSDVYCHIY